VNACGRRGRGSSARDGQCSAGSAVGRLDDRGCGRVAVALLVLAEVPIRTRFADGFERFHARRAARLIVALALAIALLVIWKPFGGRGAVVIGLIGAGVAFAAQEVIGALADDRPDCRAVRGRPLHYAARSPARRRLPRGRPRLGLHRRNRGCLRCGTPVQGHVLRVTVKSRASRFGQCARLGRLLRRRHDARATARRGRSRRTEDDGERSAPACRDRKALVESPSCSRPWPGSACSWWQAA
jgi:hypothetical protein